MSDQVLFRPSRGHVLIQPDQNEGSFTSETLICPYQKISQKATVLAVGSPIVTKKYREGRWISVEDSPDLNIGDRIYYPWRHSADLGHEIFLDGILCRLIPFEKCQDFIKIEETRE